MIAYITKWREAAWHVGCAGGYGQVEAVYKVKLFDMVIVEVQNGPLVL